MLESELFGHEKGAFTGADRRRIGKFEQCNGGTLFLDEIGDMPPATQAKMLRVLQEQAFERVGGNETIRTDVRLIAATHRDLKAWSEEGKFRPDLYYRLGVFTIHLPPLRERGDDLLMLVQYYLRRFNRELGREVREVAPEGLERLRGYPWPGNIRELQSVLKQALLKASGPVLLPAFLPEPLGGAWRSDRRACQSARARRGDVRHPATGRVRRSRPVRGDAPAGGPALAAARPGAHARQPPAGRSPAGDRPANLAPEAPGPGAICATPCGRSRAERIRRQQAPGSATLATTTKAARPAWQNLRRRWQVYYHPDRAGHLFPSPADTRPAALRLQGCGTGIAACDRRRFTASREFVQESQSLNSMQPLHPEILAEVLPALS